MKTKALIAIIGKLAAISQASGADTVAASLTDVADQLKPFVKGEVAQLFLKSDVATSSVTFAAAKPSAITMQALGDLLRRTGELVAAAGSAAKGKELLAIGSSLSESPALNFAEHVAMIEHVKDVELKRAIADTVSELARTQYDLPAFEKVVDRLGKFPVDVINTVAVGFVQGRPKYPSKPKALAAIRDKRYERAQLKAKMEGA